MGPHRLCRRKQWSLASSLPQLYVTNSTVERLGELLQARPQGILQLMDELAALFMNMSRYSGGQDNEFWLEAWNGGSYNVQRVSRPPAAYQISRPSFRGRMRTTPDHLSHRHRCHWQGRRGLPRAGGVQGADAFASPGAEVD
jgi:hypothetical protein